MVYTQHRVGEDYRKIGVVYTGAKHHLAYLGWPWFLTNMRVCKGMCIPLQLVPGFGDEGGSKGTRAQTEWDQ
jgi:hypothetical protein